MAGIETWNGVVGQEARCKIRLVDMLDEAFKNGFVCLADDRLLALSVIVGVLGNNVDPEPSAEIGVVEIDLHKTAK